MRRTAPCVPPQCSSGEANTSHPPVWKSGVATPARRRWRAELPRRRRGDGVPVELPVRQDDALRRAGAARGVEQHRGRIIMCAKPNRRFSKLAPATGVERRGVLIDVAPRWRTHQRALLRERHSRFGQGLKARLAQQDGWRGVGEYQRQLRCRKSPVERHERGADAIRTREQRQILDTISGKHTHAVA